MENVTQGWKEAQQADLLPENFIKITYRVTEPGINDTYIVTTNGEEFYSHSTNFADTEEMTKYASLEPGLWILDGSCQLLPDEKPYDNYKFISSGICDENGYFNAKPLITLSWESVHTALLPGFVIRWSELFDEYPIEYSIRVFNGEEIVYSLNNVENNSALNVIIADISNLNRIEIEIKRWNLPNHRARLEQFYVGIIQAYNKENIMSFSMDDTIDILSGSFPKQNAVFVLDNIGSQWNPFNAQGQTKYLSEQQSIHIKYGMKFADNVEWIDAGILYLSEWSTPANGIQATFTAKNILTFMEVPYIGERAGTLFEIAEAAIGQIDLPDYATYYFDPLLKDKSVDFSEDTSDYNVDEILQMVANAGNCIMYQDRKGCFRIEPAQSELSDYIIGKQWLYSWPEVSLSKKLRNVVVNDGLAIVQNDADGADQTVNNPLITTGALAQSVGEWTANILKGRTTVSGTFRPDVRLSAGDIITIENQFSESGNKIIVTSIKYSFDGGFKGTVEGRVIG